MEVSKILSVQILATQFVECRSSSTDEDNNSGSDQESLEVKLARGRAAVKCIRTIMSRMPQAKQSTRQVNFWKSRDDTNAQYEISVDESMWELLCDTTHIHSPAKTLTLQNYS